MRKRSRRGRGRGRRPGSTFVEVLPGGDIAVTASPVLSEDTEVDEGGDLTIEQSNERETTVDDSVYSFESEPSDVIMTPVINSAPTASLTLPSPSCNTNSTTISSSSSSSLDGDGASDAGENEQMHTGFMQTGPKNYRVGSTVVNLNNCSEDDVTPEFRQNDVCLQVECGDNKALMYLSKLYQGSKGKCIELDCRWFTPNEFQAVSGRESAKDWKRSIRHHGRSLKLLLSKNVLDVHPAACRCDSCSELQKLNGKTGSSGDTNRGGSGGDTSGEDKTPSNGSTGVKKRKKAKQPAPTTKMAKMTATATANTTTKLEPIGITIPKTPEKPKDDEEEKILEIPNMDSPLFKDIPPKQAESSSDSSSSSGESSSTDDSSSSDDDSDDEEEEKKDVKISSNTQKPELLEEASKPRTPIKLTISNLGKPSAKVTSTASREIIESNSSDSDTDVDDHELVKEVKVQTNQMNENIHGNQKSSHITTNSVQNDFKNEPMNDLNVRNLGIGQLPNHTQWNNFDQNTHEVRQHCLEKDLSDPVMSLNLQQCDPSNRIILKDKNPDISAGESAASKDVPEKDNIAINSSKDNSEPFKSVRLEANLENNKHLQKEGLCQEIKAGTSPILPESFSAKDDDIKPELNSALLRDSLETKYCPDGFILAPTLSKSPQHLKATLRISNTNQNSDVHKDDRSSSITEPEVISLGETLGVAEALKPLEDDSKQTLHANTNHSFPKNIKINSPKQNQSPLEEGVLDTVSNKDKFDKHNAEKKSDICEIKDQNLNNKLSNSNDKDTDKSVAAVKPETDSSELIPNKAITESARPSASKGKDLPVGCLSLSKNATTKLASSLTTFATSSGGLTSPSTRTNSKTVGFTNGIPDSENPFITWAKYDDDPLNSSIPTSSLVHALARAPFPPLSLSGESPIPQISPLGAAVPQLSPLSLAGLSPGSSQLSRMSPGSQMPRLSSPTHRLRSSPSHSSGQQQLSPPLGRSTHSGSCDGSKVTHGGDEIKVKSAPRSVKRTSRLSNIIDSLRTSKEKEAAGSGQPSAELGKKGSLDAVLGSGKKSPLLESLPIPGQKSSLSSSSPVFSSSLGSDQRAQSDRLFRDSLGFPHQISIDTQHAIRSSLDAARAQTINSSFNALKDDEDKGKRMLENLEMMKNGLLDPYKSGLPDLKSRKLDSSPSRSKASSMSLTSSTAAVSSAPSLSSRPSSRQSTKLSSQTYASTSPSSSSSRPSTTTANNSNNFSSSSTNSINNAMFQAAPSAALAAAHMELNAAAANILAFQHMYGMQDPYLIKTLMSNPLYLQRMMEFQKQAMDPLMLRQLEMFEAAAAAEKSKNKDQRAALNAQSILWQAQAASILQHQQMQQFQQLQLHHQQQLQQQAAAVRERETRETIAAIMASKSNNLSTHTNKSSGSISTGQSAKSLMASASAVPSSSSSSTLSSSSSSTNKRPRPVVPPSPSDIYSRDGASLEKKLRSSQQASSHISNHTSYHSSPSTSNTSLTSSSSKHVQMSSKPASSSSTSSKQRTCSSTPSMLPKHDLFDLPSALQLSASASPNLWGFPAMLQPPSVDMARMSRYFERPSETPSSSSSSTGAAESEATGVEVLDLSVKPRTGKT